MSNEEKVPFPETPKKIEEDEERVFNVLCPSEGRVIGVLKGQADDLISTADVLGRITFQQPVYTPSEEWIKFLQDGDRLRCPRCQSDLILAFQDLELAEALSKGPPVVLGGSRIA